MATLSQTGAISDAELAKLLNAIPPAVEGNVISTDHHNSLRDAILALGRRQSPVTPSITLAPLFVPRPDRENDTWVLIDSVAYAMKEREDKTIYAIGWLPTQLPQNAKLQTLRVYGLREAVPVRNDFQFGVTLRRLSLKNPDETIRLLEVSLRDITDFSQASSFPRATNEDALIVDNSAYMYYILADLSNATANLSLKVSGIQIIFST